TEPTDATGVADFGGAVTPGEYQISVAYPTDWSLGTWSSERLSTDLASGVVTDESPVEEVKCAAGTCTFSVHGPEIDALTGEPAESLAQLVTLGTRNPNVTVVAELYNDSDNDGVRDSSERNLAGWTAELLHGDGSPVVVKDVPLTAVTGSNGRATFYVDPGTAGGTANTYTVEYTQPADADPNWSPTPATVDTPEEWGTSAAVSVIAGESVAAPKGFIRLGTLEVVVFHDLDGDRVDDDEPRLAGRTVNLLSRNGQTVLATRVSSSTGTVAFKVAASTEYQVEIVIPAGWTQTTPLGSNGDPTTRMRVKTVADITKSTPGPDFGMWEVNDTTPPPDPTFAPGTGEVLAGSTIEISSESGSAIWYTTDGTDPNPATGVGTSTASPANVQLNGAADDLMTVKAVAVDGSGNQSAVGSALYTLQDPTGVGVGDGGGTGETRTVSPTTWATDKGSLIDGDASALATDNGLESGVGYLQMGSTRQGRNQVIWAEGSATAQTGKVTALTVTYDAIASTGGLTRTLKLWDFTAGAWVTVDEVSKEGTSPTPPRVVSITAPPRFVSSTGEIKFRVETTNKSGHELWIDQLTAEVITE
ncbi:MAG TPA: SdrD B-like domain-containing protein, partial [Ilumatobacter sp.]|nr:SdrD B-like domain-containing protein [Ilumatobacter sp.]